MLAFFRNEMGFGGNNGLTDFKDILGFSLQADSTRIGCSSPLASRWPSATLACRAIVKSKLGRVAVAIRDAEDRGRFVGYKVEHVKLAIFTFSAMLAGLAGALYVPQVGIINPGEFAPLNSIEVVVWVAMGGRATLVWCSARCHRRQLCQDLVYCGVAGVLAVRPWRSVRDRDPVVAAGHRRTVA
jgi:urea transport system permease protein